MTGQVIGDESMFDAHRGGLTTDFAPDIPDFGGQLSALAYDHGVDRRHGSPAPFAAKQLVADDARRAHQRHGGAVTEQAPRRAHKLAIVSSPPL